MLLGIFVLFFSCSGSSVQEAPSGYGPTLQQPDQTVLRQGDFIFRRGKGLLSRMIVASLGEARAISHGGIIFRQKDGSWAVIHSVSGRLYEVDGVQVESLPQFLERAVPGSVVVTRLRASQGVRDAIAGEAKRYLDAQIPFDHSFSLGNGPLYCSELLWASLPEEIREELTLFHRTGAILFESFLDARYFSNVFWQGDTLASSKDGWPADR